MSTIVKMPISNVLLGSDYTGAIMVGSGQVKLNVILDTGSSTLAVVSQDFNPSTDQGVTTTNIAQEVQYGSGSWVGAVVRTAVGLGVGVSLSGANLAVTYQESANMFGKAQGIWGLAYKTLNNAFRMPANTWTHKYRISRIETGKVCDLIAYFGQLEAAGVVANKFAFYTKRSIISAATGNPASDPLNQGFFIVGGGEEQTELYTGAFTHVDVLHDIYYNTGLLSVQVGDSAAIHAPPVPPGSSNPSNSIVDSGTNSLIIDQPLFDKILAAFGAIDANFATMLKTHALGSSQGVDQTRINLSQWPDLKFTLQCASGSPATLTVPPGDYWPFDAGQKGVALANVFGDGGGLGGMSILGLPLLNAYYTVFDRTLGGGRGAISFAKRT
jgi:Eukaryotic aspartyl protease